MRDPLRVVAVGRHGHDHVALALQEVAHGLQEVRVVIDDQTAQRQTTRIAIGRQWTSPLPCTAHRLG